MTQSNLSNQVVETISQGSSQAQTSNMVTEAVTQGSSSAQFSDLVIEIIELVSKHPERTVPLVHRRSS